MWKKAGKTNTASADPSTCLAWPFPVIAELPVQSFSGQFCVFFYRLALRYLVFIIEDRIIGNY